MKLRLLKWKKNQHMTWVGIFGSWLGLYKMHYLVMRLKDRSLYHIQSLVLTVLHELSAPFVKPALRTQQLSLSDT